MYSLVLWPVLSCMLSECYIEKLGEGQGMELNMYSATEQESKTFDLAELLPPN